MCLRNPKKRFSTLSDGIGMEHEDDVAYFITACVVLHNFCIEQGDIGTELDTLSETEVNFNPSTSYEGKRARAALLQYARTH